MESHNSRKDSNRQRQYLKQLCMLKGCVNFTKKNVKMYRDMCLALNITWPSICLTRMLADFVNDTKTSQTMSTVITKMNFVGSQSDSPGKSTAAW